jgi:(E)-4-hydroxy-3-methylbut-2-enyl-diphosphate synthase
LIKIVSDMENRVATIKDLRKLSKPIKVAMMGCIVNGPGEAKDADFAIAGGKDVGILFKNGEIIGKVKTDNWVPKLVSMIKDRLTNSSED